MRLFITGVDADGKSCIVSADEVEINSVAPGFAIGLPYSTTQSPPPARPQGNADLIDQFLEPGHVRWMVVEQGPNTETPFHHTDTLDLETVISGSVDLILDDGAHHLEAGDMVVMTGVDHAWKAGPDGYRMTAVLIGTPPPV
ncbi:cupin domain-containing protein [Mycobacterium sp. CVI_P3]|uniref:Cupin domain-containing protein n=1 Tax=Mycobacterium pinniadriaticum TaxID=2994102 RepID=A0ABT3SK85_9MYCO|nr:cupin domain-containing protein [Mycobacterium pinniadriaticum]MCX2933569.1 cupin domain-containing protein [Mycobacterium pinniadriaticum]MCX2939930.1 cupin domain-containing protein [Mycobacterium pinniadriaticum]